MPHILYGVSGEGSGHSSRAREMASHLVASGHEVKIVSYDRGVKNLSDTFDVFETEGLHIASVDNKVSVVKTFVDNVVRTPQGHRKLQELRERLFKQFRPDVVITDFEPMTAYLANHYGIPLITIDNQHRMRYMKHGLPGYMRADHVVTESIIRAMVPRPDVSLVITFFFGEVRNERTFLFPPVLRNEVLGLTATTDDHILVYLTSGYDSFLNMLRKFPRERFVVYGYNREETQGNLHFKAFSKKGFLHDLSSSRAVMATAGFTLMTESLHLRKPFMAMPMKGQFEQELNGYLLAKLGYGANLRRADSKSMASFLYHVPDYREALQSYPAADNSAIKTKLDELLADNCAMVRAFHARRSHGRETKGRDFAKELPPK